MIQFMTCKGLGKFPDFSDHLGPKLGQQNNGSVKISLKILFKSFEVGENTYFPRLSHDFPVYFFGWRTQQDVPGAQSPVGPDQGLQRWGKRHLEIWELFLAFGFYMFLMIPMGWFI